MPIFVSILIAIIIFVILLDRFIARMYRNPQKSHQATPTEYNIAYEEICIPLLNRSQLYGWWISASSNAPTIILVHGWGRNLSRMLQYIVHLYPLGYNLLAFDARNHGSSSPEKHLTVGTFTEDVLSVINFIAESGLVSSVSSALSVCLSEEEQPSMLPVPINE